MKIAIVFCCFKAFAVDRNLKKCTTIDQNSQLFYCCRCLLQALEKNCRFRKLESMHFLFQNHPTLSPLLLSLFGSFQGDLSWCSVAFQMILISQCIFAKPRSFRIYWQVRQVHDSCFSSNTEESQRMAKLMTTAVQSLQSLSNNTTLWKK